MKKIVYLHGYESKQGGPKVDFLAQSGMVYAPSLNYTDSNLENHLIKSIKAFKPDLLIGSSMGGYVANLLSDYFGIDCVLFNPAVVKGNKSRPTINELHNKYEYNEHNEPNKVIALGLFDDIIDSEKVKYYFRDTPNVIINMYKHGHRTPFEVFASNVQIALNGF